MNSRSGSASNRREPDVEGRLPTFKLSGMAAVVRFLQSRPEAAAHDRQLHGELGSSP